MEEQVKEVETSEKNEVTEHIEKTLAERSESQPEEIKEASTDTTTEDKVSEPEKYMPSFKYNVKGKEFEIPDWAKGYIDSPEKEKEVKEIFEKASGIEHIKQKHQELFGQKEELSNNYKALQTGVQELRGIYQEATGTGNLLLLDDFFGKLNIPFPVLLNYIQQKVQFQEMPEEQQRMFHGSLEAQRRARELEAQNQGLMQSQSEAASQARAMQLQGVLARPEVAQVVSQYESMPGRKPGDFWNLVKKEGEYAWFSSNGQVDLTPEEAVQRVMGSLAIQTQQPTESTATQYTKKVVAAHRETANIPNIQSKPSVSPIKKKVRTEEDLKKYYNEKYVSQ